MTGDGCCGGSGENCGCGHEHISNANMIAGYNSIDDSQKMQPIPHQIKREKATLFTKFKNWFEVD